MSNRTPAQHAAHLALMVLRELTASRQTLTSEQFDALMNQTKNACTEAGIEPVDLYRYVVSKNRDIEDAIRYSGLRQQQAGACLRFH